MLSFKEFIVERTIDIEELVSFIENDGDLYKSIVKSTQQSLVKIFKSDKYDSKKALELWLEVAKQGLKKYSEIIGDISLNNSDLKEVASILADNFFNIIGEY